jgi:hypothetical protein
MCRRPPEPPPLLSLAQQQLHCLPHPPWHTHVSVSPKARSSMSSSSSVGSGNWLKKASSWAGGCQQVEGCKGSENAGWS